MIKILLHFLFRWECILWIVGSLVLIWFCDTALFHLNLAYLNANFLEISNIYFINAFLLPFSFETSQMFVNIAVEICFLCCLFFPFLHMISYFLNDSPSMTILKKGRGKWLQDMLYGMLILCVIFLILYVALTYVFLNTQFHVNAFDMSVLFAIFWKFLFSFLSLMLYLFIYISFQDSFLSLFLSIGIYLLLNFFLRLLSIVYIDKKIIYQYTPVLSIFLLLSLFFLYFKTLKQLRKKDL